MKEGVVKSPPTLVSTDRLAFYNVVNRQNKDMGQTRLFLIDLCTGEVAFALVSFEGFLGISDKWFVLPTELLGWDVPKGKFILDLPRDVLEKAPGIDKDRWPKEIDLGWLKRACSHYGCSPYWEIRSEGPMKVPPALVRSNKLERYVITNENRENLGHCETFLVDLCNWRTPFIIASFLGAELTDKWYAIPYELSNFDTDRREFILKVPRDVIRKAHGIPKDIWGPDKIDLRWLSDACRYYGCVPYWEVK